MSGPVFGVTFDDAALAEDLAHASTPGRVIARDARRQFAAHAIAVALLRPCRDEGRDGTRLVELRSGLYERARSALRER